MPDYKISSPYKKRMQVKNLNAIYGVGESQNTITTRINKVKNIISKERKEKKNKEKERMERFKFAQKIDPRMGKTQG